MSNIESCNGAHLAGFTKYVIATPKVAAHGRVHYLIVKPDTNLTASFVAFDHDFMVMTAIHGDLFDFVDDPDGT